MVQPRRKGRPSEGGALEAAEAPPLPAPAADAAGAKLPVPDRSRCFVCGSPLAAGACPQCRVTWVE